MAFTKKMKDILLKKLWGKEYVPSGLYELEHYFRVYEPIHFKHDKQGNEIIAVSTNFKYGSIITSAENEKDLDVKIKDAILTSFELPSSYAEEAGLHKVNENQEAYALA
ncbi:MAG: hypothetical protein GF365_03950 [Candidatus Buchananbacteria bacterium]|nr:hypothetical protein [Candidatus Buchananbacteria bacterium]